MEQVLTKMFCLDGDSCPVIFIYDPLCERYFGEYPDFEDTPRYTTHGHPWVTAMQEGCCHSANRYCEGQECLDCGSCEFFMQEHPEDIIGICIHENQRKQ